VALSATGWVLQLRNGGTTGSIIGNVVINADGTFVIKRSDIFALSHPAVARS
jgi:hypothetical protein